MDFNLESLKVGQSIGCCINKDGELRYFINGVDQGVAWTGLPTDKPVWGFADIYGLARKIKSEFLFGELSVALVLPLPPGAKNVAHGNSCPNFPSGLTYIM